MKRFFHPISAACVNAGPSNHCTRSGHPTSRLCHTWTRIVEKFATKAQDYAGKRSDKAAFSPLRSTRGRKALQSLQQFRERCFEGRGNLAEGAQPRLSRTALQVRNMHLVDAGLLGKVDLPPIPGAAQFPDPLTRRRTDVLCHAFIIGLAFALYLVHTLFDV